MPSLPVLFVSFLATVPFIHAQTTTATASGAVASPDGLIVPFSSVLPACASFCGPLFDVQGFCTPPNIATINDNCFCTDSRLSAFDDDSGTSGVTAVCGTSSPYSCTSATDLQAIKTWFDNFCAANKAVTAATNSGSATASTATSTSTSTSSSKAKAASSAGQTWLQGHWKWVIMLVVVFVAIVGGWVGACLLRRRYLRKKEKEIEMLPPVALGPHQLQAMTGGYGDGVFDANKGRAFQPSHSKESSSAMVTPANRAQPKRDSRGWLRKSRI